MGNEFIVEGKKYISASRASKICGYNPDYIGQLCRKNLLDCRRVGRVWFVEEESLKSHKIVASQTPRGRIPFSRKNFETFKDGSNTVCIRSIETADQDTTKLLGSNLTFKSDSQAVTDFVDEQIAKKQSRYFVQKLVLGLVVMVLIVVVSPFALNSKFLPDHLSTFSRDKFISDKVTVFFESVQNYKKNTTGSIAYSANIFNSVGEYFGDKTFELLNDVRGRAAHATAFFNYTTNRFKLAFFDNQRTEDQDLQKERTGITVLPSAHDDEINAQVKEYVLNSFSDETEIVPDESGNSGVIKPVFKAESDQEYLYVIVPVKENKN